MKTTIRKTIGGTMLAGVFVGILCLTAWAFGWLVTAAIWGIALLVTAIIGVAIWFLVE